jgi:hypothetical protein
MSRSREGGFTLVELATVIVVSAMLLVLALPNVVPAVDRAKTAVSMSNAHIVGNVLVPLVGEYAVDRRFRFACNYDHAWLAGRLESELENLPYYNRFQLRNPYSGSQTILDWTYCPDFMASPAVFITGGPQYSYEAATQPCLLGSVVVYLENGQEEVEVYFVDGLGKKSRYKLVGS